MTCISPFSLWSVLLAMEQSKENYFLVLEHNLTIIKMGSIAVQVLFDFCLNTFVGNVDFML